MKEKWGIDIGCPACKYLNRKKLIACRAFPEIIPFIIISGNFDHRKPLPDQDNDIVFEKIKE